MEMRTPLAPRVVSITSKEKLSDRFIVTGAIPEKSSTESDPILLYSIEVTRPWFAESKLISTITSVLNQRYDYIQHSNNPLKSFEAALKNVNDELFALTESGETDWLGHVNALIVLVDGDEVHIAQTGNATAYLFRQRKISQVTDESNNQAEPHPLNTFANIISGQVTEGDRLVFSNQDLFSLVSLDQIRNAVTDQTPYVAANQIVRQIRKQKITTISTIIAAIETTATWKQAGEEPNVVLIEDVIQSWYKAVWKRVKPLAIKAGEATKTGWHRTKTASKNAQEKWQTTYGPKTKTALQKGVSSVNYATKSLTSRTHKVINSAQATIGEKVSPALSTTALAKTDRWLTTNLSPVSAALYPLKSPLTTLDDYAADLGNWLRPRVTGKNLRYVIAVGAIILLATSLVSMREKRSAQITSATIAQNNTALTTAEELLTKIDSALKLQQTVEAQNLLKQAQDTIAPLNNLTTEQLTRRDAAAALIVTKGDSLTKTTRPNPLNTLTVNGSASIIGASEKGIFALAPKENTGSFITTDRTKTTSNFTLPDNSTPVDTAYSVDKDEAIVLTADKKIISVRKDTDQMAVTKRGAAGGEFAPASRLAVFGSNLYLLDSSGGLLWKYGRTGDSYNKGISQVDQNDIVLNGAKDLAIDGYIYVLQKDGSVVKLLRGKPDSSFAVKDVPATVDPASYVTITTADSVDKLYLLANSSAGVRVVILDKSGNYQKQYAVNSIKTANDIAISPTDKALWVIGSGQAIALPL